MKVQAPKKHAGGGRGAAKKTKTAHATDDSDEDEEIVVRLKFQSWELVVNGFQEKYLFAFRETFFYIIKISFVSSVFRKNNRSWYIKALPKNCRI